MTMEWMLFALLSFSMASPDLEQTACGKYTCDVSSLSWEPSTCAWYDSTSTLWHLKACDGDYLCDPTRVLDTGNYTCIWTQPEQQPKRYTGEPCTYDSDCYAHTPNLAKCVNRFCTAGVIGTACYDSSDCNSGLYCQGGSCKYQSQDGESCIEDTDCINSSGCDIVANPGPGGNGTCVPYYSVANGTKVQSCPGNTGTAPYINFLCESATCQILNQEAICVNAYQSAYPMQCSTNAQCVPENIAVGVTANSNCKCGYTSNGTQYCDLFPGDSYFAKRVAKSKVWHQTKNILQCNTLNRNGCMQYVWTKGDFEEWNYYYLATYNYPMIAASDPCVMQIFLPGLYEAQEEYNWGTAIQTAALLSALLTCL